MNELEIKAEAAAFAGALAKTGTLWDLTAHLMALREQEEGVPAELETEYQNELTAYLTGSAEKVDQYIAVMDRLTEEAGAAAGRLEVQVAAGTRTTRRQRRNEAELEALKDRALGVIRMLGKDKADKWKPLKGTTGQLRALNVGATCEVTDGEKVPIAYKNVALSITLGAATWKGNCFPCEGKGKVLAGNRPGAVDVFGDPIILERPAVGSTCPDCDGTGDAKHVQFLRANLKQAYSIDARALLAALKKTCEGCGGFPNNDDETSPTFGATCSKCNGLGTVLIPGAKLITGRMRLIVE